MNISSIPKRFSCVRCDFDISNLGKRVVNCPNCGIPKARSIYMALIRAKIPKPVAKRILSMVLTKYELSLL